VLLLLMLPTLVVIIVSFVGLLLKFPPPGYSLRWYAALMDAWQLHFAAANSFRCALTTMLAVVLGAAALAIARSEKWTARLLDSLFMSPLVLPALAFGLPR
jgi:putative spermidine/putrescine transport system permease protein